MSAVAASRRGWAAALVLAGVAYLLIGRLFAVPRSHVHAWRLAAWLASGVVFVAHLWYERSVQRSAPRRMALHAALGVALGGFLLAFLAGAQELRRTGAVRPTWYLALVAFPLLTGLPAFAAALAAGWLLDRGARRGS